MPRIKAWIFKAPLCAVYKRLTLKLKTKGYKWKDGTKLRHENINQDDTVTIVIKADFRARSITRGKARYCMF